MTENNTQHSLIQNGCNHPNHEMNILSQTIIEPSLQNECTEKEIYLNHRGMENNVEGTKIQTSSLHCEHTDEECELNQPNKRQRVEHELVQDLSHEEKEGIVENENDNNAVINLIDNFTDESESPNEVEVISQSETILENTMEMEENEDSEINILKTNVINPNISFPHRREDCGVNSFFMILSQNETSDNMNEKYCEKCFCFVCDAPASSCTKWKNDHCHAFSKDQNWIKKKNEYSIKNGELHKIINVESPQEYPEVYDIETIPNENVEIRVLSKSHGSIIDVLSENFEKVLKTNEKEETIDEIKIDGDIAQLCLNNNFYLEGIKLGWPFSNIMTPQRQIAIRIIKGLKQRQHVVLESPTGTGKSAAILCSALAWQRYHKKTEKLEKVSQIIYCSRTHAQTAQMIESLRKTPYRPQMAVLGSRTKLCINSDVNHNPSTSAVNRGCRIRVRNTIKARRKGYDGDNNNYIDSPSDNDDDGMDDNDIYESNNSTRNNTQMRTNDICPHYKQLEEYNTSLLAYNSFIPPSNRNCIDFGGEKSKLGIHDIEDLIAFGEKPTIRRNIAIYRRPSEKFGMQLAPEKNENLLKIATIHKGGATDREGSLSKGDVVVNINNQSCCSSTFQDNIMRIKNTAEDKPLLIDAVANIPTYEKSDTSNTEAVCPYYISQLLSSHAEIVFAPYEYILDENIRNRVNFSLDNSVIVLDEAHNIEDKLRSNGSIELQEVRLRNLSTMLQGYRSPLADDIHSFVADLVKYLERIRVQFYDDYDANKYQRSIYKSQEDYQLSYHGPTASDRKKSNGCARFIDDAELNDHNFSLLKFSIDSLLSKLQQNWEKFSVFMEHLDPLMRVLSALIEPEHYFISTEIKKDEISNKRGTSSTSSSTWSAYISINLLNPALLFRPLMQKSRSIILASGTLAPIESLCAELDLKPSNFIASSPSSQLSLSQSSPILSVDNIGDNNSVLTDDRLQIRPAVLEANHIINMKKQLLATSVGFFPDGSSIFASKKNYVKESFQQKLGIAIANIVERVPSGGVLVFLPNKSLIRKCEFAWKNNCNTTENSYHSSNITIWERLLRSKKKVMIEDTKTAHDFEVLKEEYADAIRCQGSCILLAVYRGRMSEGISFNDENARAVICVGVPLAPYDAHVKAKQAYNDNQRKFTGRSVLTGREWYKQDAYRALSQALGRCIRHYKDYGAIILMDVRHCREEERQYLPKWFKTHIRNVDIKANMQGFFNQSDKTPICGGWKGFLSEIKQFFDEAPTHVKDL